jgi:methyl-accepting chemotaxis protein
MGLRGKRKGSSEMEWFKNLRIGTKLLVTVMTVVALAVGVGVFSMLELAKVNDVTVDISTNWLRSVSYLSDLRGAVNSHRRAGINHVLATDADTFTANERVMASSESQLKEVGKNYEKVISTEEERRVYERFRSAWEIYVETANRLNALNRAQKHEEALQLNLQAKKLVDAAIAALNEDIALNNKGAEEVTKHADEIYRAARNLIVIMLVLAAIVGTVLAIAVARTITKALNEGIALPERLAEGDLGVTFGNFSKDEAGRLLQALSRMVKKLTEVVVGVATSASNVATGSEQLSATSAELSQGSTEQASSVEEVSASMEQTSSNIKQNADNATQTETIALKAANDAKEGGEAVAQTVNAMKQIASKISIIEEIAHQTNLLALNAAIEAARAGEHGKGFAVVAAEVRRLAERSQKAAGEITELSKTSVNVAERAGDLLSKILPDVKKTAELVQEITASSREQDSGVQQINRAVQQLDEVIQKNAAAAEEMSSTSEELSGQAQELQVAMGFFKVSAEMRKAPSHHAIRKTTATPVLKKAVTAKKTTSSPAPSQHPEKSSVAKGVDLALGADSEDAGFESF